MSLEERVYSVLIVSATDRFNQTITSLLPETTFNPIYTASSISAAKRILIERSFDFILINSPLRDGVGTRFAIQVSAKQTVVLLLVRNEIYVGIQDEVAEYGVFSLPKPTTKQILIQAFDWMVSARERLRQFEKKTISIEEKMAEIRLVNRAKWLLISELKMTEPDAHRHIEKQAMDRCTTKKKIAEEIIKIYS